ncbi:MBL fold metallo-hydrolase [Nocardia sp. NPDC023852]|uniref:MBL fold metallo-hydrolase n=1 Tax=Nocardia sp. NPDC023852 TaxID=3154697 RepID=UPI0033E26423
MVKAVAHADQASDVLVELTGFFGHAAAEFGGLILVETGIGLDDARDPEGTLGADRVAMSQAVLSEVETAIRQVERLGYAADDVGHIILTHLDVDHCGGLPDFPHARVHVLAAELEAALVEAPSFRYRPAHWAHDPWEFQRVG